MSSAKQSVGSSVMSLLTSKSLSSMVKGIRTHKTEHAGNRHAEGEFIAKCMAEIKEELKTNFPDVKAVAIQKLIYVSAKHEKQAAATGRAVTLRWLLASRECALLSAGPLPLLCMT